MSSDQIQRIRECAFDEDITYILEHIRKWFEDDSADALAQCLEDIRDILEEGES